MRINYCMTNVIKEAPVANLPWAQPFRRYYLAKSLKSTISLRPFWYDRGDRGYQMLLLLCDGNIFVAGCMLLSWTGKSNKTLKLTTLAKWWPKTLTYLAFRGTPLGVTALSHTFWNAHFALHSTACRFRHNRGQKGQNSDPCPFRSEMLMPWVPPPKCDMTHNRRLFTVVEISRRSVSLFGRNPYPDRQTYKLTVQHPHILSYEGKTLTW